VSEVEARQATERRTETEEVLAGFWTEVLEADAVGPDDRILELGGNSLLATMVANRIELAWGFRPSMEELLTSSLRELADACERARSEQAP
jgi:Phosphopantetheine attachment site